MEFPRELWEGQNMEPVTHKYANIDVHPFGENDFDRCVQSFQEGGVKAFTEHLSPHILAVMLATICYI